MLTEHQINNLHKLPKEDLKIILDNCIDALGIVDIEDAEKALCISRSRVYQIMNENNTLEIGKHKFLMINVLQHTQNKTT